MKDPNARFLNKVFCEERLCSKLVLAETPIFVQFYFFFSSGMLINTVPDDCLMYIGFHLFLFLILHP